MPSAEVQHYIMGPENTPVRLGFAMEVVLRIVTYVHICCIYNAHTYTYMIMCVFSLPPSRTVHTTPHTHTHTHTHTHKF